MVGQAKHDGRRAGVIATPLDRLSEWLAQGGMGPPPVVLEEGQADRGIPQRRLLGEGMGLAGEAGQPVAPHAVEAFEVDRVRLLRHGADRCAHLDSIWVSRRPRRCLTAWVRATPGVRCRIDQS